MALLQRTAQMRDRIVPMGSTSGDVDHAETVTPTRGHQRASEH